MLTLDDADVFLKEFGGPVVSGSIEGLGILDEPGKVVAGGTAISTEYELTCRTDLFGNIKKNDPFTVKGLSYKAREAPLPMDDGMFCHIFLTKV
ncbi:MAG: hypothetical protein V4525_10985 [Pseudomonadota bacterium]